MKYLALGKRLRQLRQDLDLTQKELGKRIGFSDARVSHYENGEIPPREYLETFIQKLGLEAYAPELWTLYADAKKTSRHNESDSTHPLPSNTLPPAWSTSAQSRNLPHHAYYPLDQCEALLNKITAQLANMDDHYVLALCGSGGVGKTTIALEAARRVLSAGQFVDAVWFSAHGEWLAGESAENSLPLVRSFEQLLDALAQQMGLEDVFRQDFDTKRRTIADHLWSERFLILFDNFETWQAAKPLTQRLAPILGRSRLLITTRDGRLDDLDLIWIHIVKGLSKRDASHFMQREGERLGLALRKPELDALRELYPYTGGIPFALKRVLSHLLNEGIAPTIHFLTDAPAPERYEFYAHLFLREWHRLDADAQRLWIYLGRMIPTSIAHAQLLRHADDAEACKSALSQLRAHFLLEASENTEPAAARYSLHPLARQFIQQIPPSLITAQELAAHHARGCVFQAAAAWQAQVRADPKLLLNPSDRANILFCARECARLRAQPTVIALWDVISTPLYEFGFWNEYLELEYAALRAAQELEQRALQGEILNELAWLAMDRGELDQAEDLARRALQIYSALEDRRGIVIAKRYRATILMERKEFILARAEFEKLLDEIHRYQADTDAKLARALFSQEITTHDSLGIVLTELGEYDSARRELKYAFQHAPVRGEPAQAESLYNLGILARKQNENELAKAYLQDCLTLCQKINLKDAGARALFQLAQLASADGKTVQAQNMAEQARRIFHALGASANEKQVAAFLRALPP